mmetsp:Transcript_21148/g.15469  ORF Transcript_21148/g.15469 Transcript_21148/m.15469 type:complete len:136 (+) Transcript_21148:410-817(+)|eukprot:CAMPEP_0202971450 /NCGR_PEP_ID=MMETSP1396-20130829/27327_1 /ASSEMBLY_ACC=CAM_ASM_000872 /TAXON_ID= /ORGANISM="Pseudokeronopsis sp., Strain Brazil" /LENGTH=135 /DNA_ID=CAMNT_0049700847 /DNA_START=409 /DNA_END=816 /DNA_ORIENTATION=+
MFSNPNKSFPGPGQYNELAGYENKNGHYFTSRMKSPGCVVISKQGKRFEDLDLRRSQEVPGPGQYQGGNIRIAYKSPGTAVFGRERRLDSKQYKKETPGPGNYRIHSDFGYYDPADATGHKSIVLPNRNISTPIK